MNQPAPTVLCITGEMSIYRAAELKATLLAALAESAAHGGGPDLALDLAGVSVLDSAGVQLLMLAKQTALAAQGRLRLQAHSSAVTEVFELMNLAAYFGDPLVMDSRGPAAPATTGNGSAA